MAKKNEKHSSSHNHAGSTGSKPSSSHKRLMIPKGMIVAICIVAFLAMFIVAIGNFNSPQNPPSDDGIGAEDNGFFQTVDPRANQPSINTTDLERRIHDLVNNERESVGLRRFPWNTLLNKIATQHSRDMAERRYFAHESPEGYNFSDRYVQNGMKCTVDLGRDYDKGAENIFMMDLYQSKTVTDGIVTSYEWNTDEDIAQTTVDWWISVNESRRNILASWYAEGIGVAISQEDDKVYITQNFC